MLGIHLLKRDKIKLMMILLFISILLSIIGLIINFL